MTLKIEQEEAQKILNYLASRPYAEVAELVPVLLNLKREEPNLDASKTTEEIFGDDNLVG
jgi:hypothetical protein